MSQNLLPFHFTLFTFSLSIFTSLQNQWLRSFTAGAGGQQRNSIQRGLGTERSRLGTFRGFGIERARLGPFRGFGTELARLGTF